MRGLILFGSVAIVAALVGVSALPAQGKKGAEAEMKAWTYPGARQVMASSSGGLSTAVTTTADDLPKVLDFYEKKFGMRMPAGDPPSAHAIVGQPGKTTAAYQDSAQPPAGKGDQPRAVTLCFCTQTTDTYVVSVTVSRVKGEDHTHIALAYVRK